MNLSVGVWPSRRSFDKWYQVKQYEGTDAWTQSFPLMGPDTETKAMTSAFLDHVQIESSVMVSPVDAEVDQPFTVHAIIKGNSYEAPPSQQVQLDKYTLSRAEKEAGCCVLCRVSGHSGQNGRPEAAGFMFVLSRDGQPIKQLLGREYQEVCGAWMPCCGDHPKSKGNGVAL